MRSIAIKPHAAGFNFHSHRHVLPLLQLVLWTAGVVVLTLAINAPVIPPLIDRLGLLDVPPVKARMRAKAARAVLRFSRQAVHDLQQDPDEMLRGVHHTWGACSSAQWLMSHGPCLLAPL